MDVHEALYTTRAMRRVRPDPIPEDAQRRILDAAIRAPSGGNQQYWRFLLVDDPATKERLGPLYRDALDRLWETVYKPMVDRVRAEPDTPENVQAARIMRSSRWLGEHFERVPLFLFAYARHDLTGGSIFPAVWSAQLAARAEGIGSTLTMLLGLFHPDETHRILGVPQDEGWSLAATVSFGHPLGRWGVAARRPVHEVSYRNRWGEPVGFEIPEPLWRPR
ncbi:nitroreductase family protein [Actinomadura kijaniata]|uniref:nitroreductase family protein n=1 Tax=Actinomadura kijaniata TaxID=46161 RepID=UPI000829D4D0|nr:nitroreductase family protein [Actinomadura kijaniata]